MNHKMAMKYETEMEMILYSSLENASSLYSQLMIMETVHSTNLKFNEIGSIIELFKCSTQQDASHIADTIAKILPPYALDRESTKVLGKFVTIRDYLGYAYMTDKKESLSWIAQELKKRGFKKACECNEQILWRYYDSSLLYLSCKAPNHIANVSNINLTIGKKRNVEGDSVLNGYIPRAHS